MQSKKRFTEINIWEAVWFMELTPQQKLFWRYLNDRCDNIGIWEPNFKLVVFNLDIEGKPREFGEHFLEAINKDCERVKVLSDGCWFLTGFVKFQYCKENPLNEKSPAHRSYLSLMRERGMLNWFRENQPEILPEKELSDNSKRPLEELSESYKDKDKDTDTDKETDSEKDTALSFSDKASKLLSEWPNPNNEVFFEEQIKCEQAIERLTESGLSVKEAESSIREQMKEAKRGNGVSLSGLLDRIGRESDSLFGNPSIPAQTKSPIK